MNDPFDTLGLPATFDLDPAAVSRAYFARAAGVHPDLARGDSPRGDVERAAASLNEARRVLADPEKRAAALLARLSAGVPGLEGDEKRLPAGFLPEIMEVREEIESDKAAATPGWMEKWEAWARGERKRYAERASALFSDAQRATAEGKSPAEALKSVRIELNAWRYIERLIEQLDPDHEGPEVGRLTH